MSTPHPATRLCPCFAGSPCACDPTPHEPFIWRGRAIGQEILLEAHRDFRMTVMYGFAEWSVSAWRAFLQGYMDMAAFYAVRDGARTRAYAA